MKTLKIATALAIATFAFGNLAHAAEEKPAMAKCCAKAAADGKTCAHSCCVKAAEEGKGCEKCGAPKKKDASAT